jgi:4-hydroxy-3-polyprenylbenzoate decarboxylase
MEDAYIGKATERIFLTPIKMTMLPELLDMDLPYAGVAHNITIIKIDKSFAGHAQKVMNALWGAGQMMFNKIMIIVDQETDVHHYQEVLKAIAENVDVESDIVFNKGPLDVLDHSSSRFAFGSKMGIDATKKLPEEIYPKTKTEKHQSEIQNYTQINTDIEDLGLVIISVDKNKFRFKTWVDEQKNQFSSRTKIVVFVDKQIDTKNLFNVCWTASNHTEPQRDSLIVNGILFIDGTKKTKAVDGFERQWPNPVVMDDKTIAAIDLKWKSLGLGELIESPSNYYKSQMHGLDAIAKE